MSLNKTINIGLDIRIFSQPLNGVARYTLALLTAIEKHPSFKLYLFSDTPINPTYLNDIKGHDVIVLKNKSFKKYWKDYILPYYLFKLKINIYHATWDKGTPRFSFCPTIMTIHDLYCISKNNTFLSDRKKKKRLKSLLIETKTCSKIFTVSNYTKNEIIKALDVPKEKITITKLDCDRKLLSKIKNSNTSIKEYYPSLSEKQYFIGIVGRLNDKRKNIPFIINSFKSFLEKNTSSKIKTLVLVGNIIKDSPDCKEILDLIKYYKLENNIILTGFLEDDALYNLLKHSVCLIFTSLFEGFGIPILEAFYLDTPVITSNTTSMAELASNDSALLVDPYSLNELTEAMTLITSNKNLKENLISKANKQLRNFDWNITEKDIIKQYELLIKET